MYISWETRFLLPSMKRFESERKIFRRNNLMISGHIWKKSKANIQPTKKIRKKMGGPVKFMVMKIFCFTYTISEIIQKPTEKLLFGCFDESVFWVLMLSPIMEI